MTAPPNQNPTPSPNKINSTVLGFLASLAIKGGVDTACEGIPNASDLNQVWEAIGFVPAILFSMFFLTILRFLYGAFRFQEEEALALSIQSEKGRTVEAEWWVQLWNIFGALLLFILFYVSGLSVRHPEPYFFFMLLIHVVDLFWFMVSRRSRVVTRKLRNVMCSFFNIDVGIIFALGGLLVYKSYRGVPDTIFVLIGSTFLLVSALYDGKVNFNFFFNPTKWRAAQQENKMNRPNRLYFAGPLFTQAEWLWNAQLATELRKSGIEVILPQERAAPMLNGEETFDPEILFRENVEGLEKADVVLAILDQPDPDSGTCWECGHAYSLGRPIIGLRTDLRASGDDDGGGRAINLMLARSCKNFISLPLNKRDDMNWIAQQVLDALRLIESKD